MAGDRSRIKQGFVDIPEGQIHYRTAGDGPALLLLHLTTFSSDVFSDVMPILATRYKVIAMDRFGHGGSDPLPEEVTIEVLTRAVINFLDALHVDRSYILGQHTGCYEGIEVAIAQPERVEKLVLVGLPDRTPEERAQQAAKDLGEPDRRKEPKMDGAHLKREWDHRIEYAGTPAIAPEIMHRIFMAAIKSTAAVRHISLAVARHDIRKRLPLVRTPTLFMCGESDHHIGDLNGQRSLLPPDVPAETVVIKGAGTYAPMQNPEEYAGLVMSFLAKP